jgi:transcriptional regulator with XRE-family HTH domain
MTEIDILLGLSIAERRKRLGLSRADLATKLSVSEYTIGEFEQGTRRAAASQLFDLADALDIPVTALFPSTTEEKAWAPPPEGPAAAGFSGALEVESHYYALSRSQRAASFAFLVALQLNPDEA